MCGWTERGNGDMGGRMVERVGMKGGRVGMKGGRVGIHYIPQTPELKG